MEKSVPSEYLMNSNLRNYGPRIFCILGRTRKFNTAEIVAFKIYDRTPVKRLLGPFIFCSWLPENRVRNYLIHYKLERALAFFI